MTGLIGGSLLLLIASAVALFFGWITADSNLIWVSIVASGLSAVLLALGYGRSRDEIDRAVAIAMRKAGIPTQAEARAAAAAKPRPAPATPAPAPRRSEQPDTAAMAAVDDDGSRQVVAVPARKRYHRPDCRFSAAKGAHTVSLAAAKRRGYDACGVCKP